MIESDGTNSMDLIRGKRIALLKSDNYLAHHSQSLRRKYQASAPPVSNIMPSAIG